MYLRNLLIFTILLFGASSFADQCETKLSAEDSVEIHHRGVNITKDLNFETQPGESWLQGRQRRRQGVFKMLRWAAFSPSFSEQSRSLDRSHFYLAVPLGGENTSRHSRQKIQLEYKLVGTDYILDNIRIFQENGKSFVLDKSPLNSDGNDLRISNLIWKVEATKNISGKIIDEVVVIKKDREDESVFRMRKGEDRAALESKIVEMNNKSQAEGKTVGFEPSIDLHALDIPVRISGKIKDRFEKWGARFEYVSDPAKLQKIYSNTDLVPQWFSTTFHWGVQAFFKRGMNRAMNGIWLAIAFAGYMAYNQGLHFSIDQVNGINQLRWSFSQIFVNAAEADVFSKVQSDMGLTPLAQDKYTLETVIRGPIDFKALGLKGQPDLHIFEGQGFASIYKAQGIAVVTAITNDASSGETVAVSRIVNSRIDPDSYIKLVAKADAIKVNSISVPSPDEILEN